MAGLNLAALKQIPQTPSDTSGLATPTEDATTPQVVASATTPVEETPKTAKPRTNRISIMKLRNGESDSSTPKTVAKTVEVPPTEVVAAENTPPASENTPVTETAVVETEAMVATTVSTEGSTETNTSTETSAPVVAVEESASILPVIDEEAIVSTPNEVPIALPKEFFPGLSATEDIENMEGDIMRLESDMHMSEVIVERALHADAVIESPLSTPESLEVVETTQTETLPSSTEALTESAITQEEPLTEDTPVILDTEVVAEVINPVEIETTESIEASVENTMATEDVMEEIVEIPSEAAMEAATSAEATTPEVTIETSEALVSSDEAPTTEVATKITPEYVKSVKEFLSFQRIGGFKYFAGKKGYVIAGLGMTSLLAIAGFILMSPLGSSIAPHTKTSISEAITGTKATTADAVTNSGVSPAGPDYSAGTDYTVIKNTKKNRKSGTTVEATPSTDTTTPPAPTDAAIPSTSPADASPMPPAETVPPAPTPAPPTP